MTTISIKKLLYKDFSFVLIIHYIKQSKIQDRKTQIYLLLKVCSTTKNHDISYIHLKTTEHFVTILAPA
jgi:hypothetical protein